jgi:hypothetical protein
LLVSAALALEWLCLLQLRTVQATARVSESVLQYATAGKVGDLGAVLLLVPGIYMLVAVWGDARRALFGFVGLVLIGVIGGTVTGRTMKRIKKILAAHPAGSEALATLVNSRALRFSIRMRTAIFLGVVFLMTAKPGLAGSLVTFAVSLAAGALMTSKNNAR